MDEWTVKLKFPTYEISSTTWAKDKSEVRKKIENKFYYGKILEIKNTTNRTNE